MISATNSSPESVFTWMNGRIRRPIEAILLGQSLKARVLRGGAWLGSGSIVEQMLRFGRNMLLARLLAPAAFGTMAIALSSASVVDALLDVGVREAIIQNPRGAEDRYLNVAWWLSMGRGVLFYFVMFSIAPWISRFYGNPELLPLLRVALVSVLFHSAMSSGANLAIKQMKFSRWTAINHGGAICGVVLTVILSFFIRDVWALAIGYCAENASRCILSYFLCPYLPSLAWNKEAARGLLRFSKGVFGMAFLNLIFLRADIFVLGKLYSATSLGLYTLAVHLIQTPTAFFMSLLGQILLPTFSQLQENKDRINRILIKITSLILVLGLPLVLFVFFCGHSLLTIAYGYRYAAVAGPLVVASCVALMNLANGQITTAFLARGRPQLHRSCVAIMAVTMIVLIYPLAKWLGLVGAQVACFTSIAFGYLFQVVRIRQLTNLDLRQYGKSFLISAAISLCVVIICLGARPLVLLARPVPNVMLGIMGCLLAYAIACTVFVRRRGEAAVMIQAKTGQPT